MTFELLTLREHRRFAVATKLNGWQVARYVWQSREMPFREPAESPTTIALARLDALRVHPIRRALDLYTWYRASPRARARPAIVARAESLGLVRIGCAVEGVVPVAYRKRIFVDRARTTQAHISARYFFITYFESGKCIITWDHIPQTPSTAMLESRRTAGSFERDYEAHALAVKNSSTTETPIVVTDLQTAIALGRIYYRHVVPLGLAVMTLLSWPVLAAILAFAVWKLLRH
jgi:hypothetical protein